MKCNPLNEKRSMSPYINSKTFGLFKIKAVHLRHENPPSLFTMLKSAGRFVLYVNRCGNNFIFHNFFRMHLRLWLSHNKLHWQSNYRSISYYTHHGRWLPI